MKKIILGLIISMMILAGCSDSSEIAHVDEDIQYVAIDSDGELVIRPVTVKEIQVHEVQILTEEEYRKKKGGNVDEDALKQALLKK